VRSGRRCSAGEDHAELTGIPQRTSGLRQRAPPWR
jgi:hypothetical protein